MSRPITWLPRLSEIRRSVANSVRSHYSTRDLGLLFKLQPRSVTKLLKVLPVVLVGMNHMVQREALVEFLDKAKDTEDVSALCIQRRAETAAVSRQKPRTLVRRDFETVAAADLMPWLSRGHVEFDFNSAQMLFDALWRIASALQDDLEEFCRLFEPGVMADPERECLSAERKFIQDEIEGMRVRWEERQKVLGR